VAGASSGTLLLSLVKTVPDPWKPVVTYLSPWIAVFATALFAWVQRFVLAYIEDKWQRRTSRVQNEYFDQAQRTLEAAVNNPLTGAQQREEFQKKLAKLQKLRVDFVFDIVDRKK
jgi:hypothetical protein